MTAKLTLLATAFSTSFILAEDYEVKAQTFEQSITLEGLAVPSRGVEIEIQPQTWADFIVEKVVEHGTSVKKGDVLISLKSEKIDDFISVQELEAKLNEVKLAKLQQEVEELKAQTERELLQARTTWEREQEDYDYYQKVTMPLANDATKLRGERAEWYLDYTKEELRQLLKMYEADGLTEETEEIIVQRARNAVKAEEFDNKQAQETMRRSLETSLPRQEKDRKRDHVKKQVEWDFAQKSIPRKLEEKEAELAKFQHELKLKAVKLEQVKADRKLMQISAPQDGTVYYGEFEGAHWKREIANKVLLAGAKIPPQRVLMTLIPSISTKEIQIAADAYAKSRLDVGDKGSAKAESNPWQGANGEVMTVATVPNTNDGKWKVGFQLDTKADEVTAGEKLKVTFLTYEKEDTLSVPVKAISAKADGRYSVKLKQEEGEPIETIVTVGESNATHVEVLSGLKVGQVIVFESGKK
jgi:hypothetical protein